MDERIAGALEQDATIVTAGRRLARTLTLEYNARQQQRGAAAWPAPAILPWGGWINALWDECLYKSAGLPVRLGPWQERTLWERVLEEGPESSALLQVSATAAAAEEAWNLAIAWRLDPEAIEAEGNDDARAFVAWVRRFEQISSENGWIPGAQAPDALARAIDTLRLPSRILLAGFDEFTPQQTDLIEACRRAGCDIATLRPPAGGAPAAAVRVPFPDAVAELTAAARWTRSLLEKGDGRGIAVVVPDLAQRRRAVERIFRSVLEPGALISGRASTLINFSAGESLETFPAVAAAFGILALRPEHNDWREVSAFVRDPHTYGAETERTRRGMLDAALRSMGAAEVSIEEVERLCRDARCPLLNKLLRRWRRVYEREPERQAPAGWSCTFSDMLEAAGWPGERPLNSAGYQAVKAFTELLSDFAATSTARGEIAMGEAVAQLRRMAGGTMFQPETPHAPVQILGSFEAAGLRFDHLWVAGLHDEAWPEPARPNPFLPIRLQRAAGLPHSSPERELDVARRVTERLLASAPDLVMSYPVRDGDRDLAPSPLILHVPKADPAGLPQSDFPPYAGVIFDSSRMEQVVDEQGPALAEASRQRGGTRVFQYQAACPFRAFVELRLGVEPLEAPEPGLDPRDRGTLVHAALETVWGKLKTQANLCACNDLKQVIADAAEQAMLDFEARRGAPLPERYAALERRRTEQLIGDWLEVEKQREPFEVVASEGERYIEVSGIRCKVKLDRVDRLPDGREIIIDYKTGQTSAGKWESDRPEEPQLPLYSVKHPNRLAGVLFAQIRPGDTKFKGWVEGTAIPGAEAIDDLAAKVEEWRAVLERLGGDFRAGHAEPDPKKPGESCRYCRLALLCRTGESNRDGAEEI